MRKQESGRPRSLWLRLYTGVIEDAKVMQLPCSLFKTWVLTLCMAKEEGGRLPEMSVLAFKLRLRVDVAKQHIDSLVDAGLIDRKEDHLTPHNWDKYQYASDVSTERVKQHRNAKRNAERNSDETFQERPQRTETETEKETNKEARVSSSTGVDGVTVSRSSITKQQAAWFEEWWKSVWMKVGRGAAEKAFTKLVRDEQTFLAVKKGTEWFTLSLKLKDPQFWPHPSTWLNQKRWMDEPTAIQPALPQYRESEVW